METRKTFEEQEEETDRRLAALTGPNEGQCKMLDKFDWKRAPFHALLRAEHVKISALDLAGFFRWQLHQKLSQLWQEHRAQGWQRPDAEFTTRIVLGVFDAGTVYEKSLFDAPAHERPDKFYIQGLRGGYDLVIGWGCEDLDYLSGYGADAYNVQPADYGWVDGMGEHIEEMVHVQNPRDASDIRIFYHRLSMSGRHDYLLRILPPPPPTEEAYRNLSPDDYRYGGKVVLASDADWEAFRDWPRAYYEED